MKVDDLLTVSKESQKKIITENVQKFIKSKSGLHQRQKEEGQIDCLVGYLTDTGNHLSLKGMSDLLIESGYFVGSSVKTIYRRILPELLEHGAVKDDEGKYYIREKKQAGKAKSKKEETLPDARIVYIDEHDTALYKTFSTIKAAMEKNLYVHIVYGGAGEGKKEKYTVQPYQLILKDGRWNLWGMCTSICHNGKKLFNLADITEVKILNTNGSFILPADFAYKIEEDNKKE
ncbi:MAG: WYL domain-containing protein [Spirochaetales bacterium]|nr:WYL domain-containing protein [Spirochaetia bacterium]MDD7458648.1 WYL domain-containing protein [Spirochaetales bacterium]